MGVIMSKLESMGIMLPRPPAPAGSYVPVRCVAKDAKTLTAHISGQIPVKDGKVAFTGAVSDENLDEARESARLCAVNMLSQLDAEARRNGSCLDNVTKFVSLSGFVNSDPGFYAHPKVIDAASDLLFDIFGEIGLHSRMAVGVSSLPLNSMTEIGAVAEFAVP